MVQGFWSSGLAGTTARMNQALLQQAAFASRPAAGNTGALFYATDTGRLYRDNGSSWDQVLLEDHATLPALHTIGTGATQAAAGNHTHTVSDIGETSTEAEDPGGSTNNSIKFIEQPGTSYGTGISVSHTIGGSGKRAIIVVAAFTVANDDTVNARTVNIELRRSTTQLVERTGLGVPATVGGVNTNSDARTYIISHVDVDVAAGATTYDARILVDSGTTVDILGRSIQVVEVAIP